MSSSSPLHAPTILLLGDSLLAWGDWNHLLPGCTINNCGIPGLTAFELRQALPRIERLYRQADVLLVMIGTNDLLQLDMGFLEDLRCILEDLTKAYPSALRIACNLLPMEVDFLSAQDILTANDGIAAIARQLGWQHLDLYRHFQDSREQLFQADGVHLTPAAYRLWAELLRPYCQSPQQ